MFEDVYNVYNGFKPLHSSSNSEPLGKAILRARTVVHGFDDMPTRVDVVQLAPCARTPDLIAPSVLEELILASCHRGRNGAVIPHRNKRQPAQNTSDGHHVGNRARLGLIQLLRPALASLPPPSGGAPEGQEIKTVHTQFRFGLHKVW